MNLCFTEAIQDYPGYIITRDGRVISLTRKITYKDGRCKVIQGKILKPGKNKKGYLTVNLYNEKGRKGFSVHRLVALAFISNPENKPEVNHKHPDGDKTRNNDWNLEWATNKENQEHSYRVLKNKPTYGNKGFIGIKSKLAKSVIQLNKDGSFVKKWDCIRDVTRDLGFCASTITKCCLNKNKTYKKFIWKYND